MNFLIEADNRNYTDITVRDNYFQYYFIALFATCTGFHTCRPFLALDGYHTKSRFRMTLLLACTLNSNNEILPLAWAIVPIEDGENW
jgi:hypothetical protein